MGKDTIKLTEVFASSQFEEDSFGMDLLKLATGMTVIGMIVADDWVWSKGKRKDVIAKQEFEANKNDIIYAEAVSVEHPLYAHGAKTVIYDQQGQEKYITQPVGLLQKMGVRI